MAARTPRRSFATPFVITLAAVPGCYVQSSPAPSQPDPQAQPAQQPDSHPVIVANPPRPQPDPATPPPPPQPQPNPSVVMNPPRPQPQPAPPPQPQPIPRPNPSVVMNPPRPQGPVAGTSWHVFKTQDGCEAIVNVECPKGAACNPPPPTKVDCPTGISAPKGLTIVAAGDGTCHVEQEPMHCPPHAMCNPPRPQQVTCPK